MDSVEGIVLSTRDYSESSKILNVLTKEYGIIGVIAKGSKSLKSNLRSVTDKLTYGVFNIYYKENKLSTLVSVDVINSFKNIKKDITKISFAGFLLELSEQVMRHGENGQVYDLLINSLIKIDEGFDPLVITNIIEFKYLSNLGVMPVLDSCSICGKKVNIVTLSSDKGGLVCSDCYRNEIVVDPKTIKLVRMFYYVDISKISKLDISDKCKREINNFLDLYYDRYTGLFLKSKEFIKNLNKIVG